MHYFPPHYRVAYCRTLNTSVDFLAFLKTLGAFLKRVLKCGLGVLSDHLDTANFNLNLPVGKVGGACEIAQWEKVFAYKPDSIPRSHKAAGEFMGVVF